MKITRARLKQIIQEAIEEVEGDQEEFEFGKSKEVGSTAREKGIDIAKAQSQAGIDDYERAIIAQLSQALTAAAKETNLKSGNIKRYSELLFQALKDVLEKQP